MNRKKTVAIFSAYIVPHLGGIERYTDSLTRQFVKLGIQPIVVTTNFDNSTKEYEKDGIYYLKLPIYSIFKNRYPIIKKDKVYKKLLSKLDTYSIDAIIVNTRFHLTSHVGANYGYSHHIPVYLIEHGSNYVTLDNKFIDFFANRYEDFLTWKIKKKVKGFYGVSKAAGEWLKQLKITYSGIWYNSIDTDQVIPERKKHTNFRFLYAGRLIKQKGVENILLAFQELANQYSDIDLVIAGNGPELEEYKAKFNIKCIRFVGKLNFKQLSQYYSETDVFLYPPLWPEGLPTSILEAGLMGCAVIGTNQGGIQEVIQNQQNGFIVSGSVSSLKEAMELLYLNREMAEKFACKLRKTIETDFSWKVTARKVAKDIGVI